MKRQAAATSPARALRDHVEAVHREGDGITVATDANSQADVVLVAMRIADAAFVIAVDRKEYDGFALLKILGVRNEPVKNLTMTPLPRRKGTA